MLSLNNNQILEISNQTGIQGSSTNEIIIMTNKMTFTSTKITFKITNINSNNIIITDTWSWQHSINSQNKYLVYEFDLFIY